MFVYYHTRETTIARIESNKKTHNKTKKKKQSNTKNSNIYYNMLTNSPRLHILNKARIESSRNHLTSNPTYHRYQIETISIPVVSSPDDIGYSLLLSILDKLICDFVVVVVVSSVLVGCDCDL